jgi:hypothetical protein
VLLYVDAHSAKSLPAAGPKRTGREAGRGARRIDEGTEERAVPLEALVRNSCDTSADCLLLAAAQLEDSCDTSADCFLLAAAQLEDAPPIMTPIVSSAAPSRGDRARVRASCRERRVRTQPSTSARGLVLPAVVFVQRELAKDGDPEVLDHVLQALTIDAIDAPSAVRARLAGLE